MFWSYYILHSTYYLKLDMSTIFVKENPAWLVVRDAVMYYIKFHILCKLLRFNIFYFLRLLTSLRPDLRPATLLKKRLWHRCFHMCFVNFAKFLTTPFLQNICGRLLLVFLQKILVFALTYPLRNLFSKFD